MVWLSEERRIPDSSGCQSSCCLVTGALGVGRHWYLAPVRRSLIPLWLRGRRRALSPDREPSFRWMVRANETRAVPIDAGHKQWRD